MTKIDKVLFTGKTHTTHTTLNAAHGNLDIKLSPGKNAPVAHEFLATPSHPLAEQLFAGAWSACYTAALGIVAAERKVTLPADLAVEIEVDLGMTGKEYFLQARINVRAPGVDHDVATEMAHTADTICPYSKATRGNIDVALTVVTD